MASSHYYNLINQGRKAGLQTSELYRAMSTLSPNRHHLGNGQSDTNGFVSDVNQNGNAVYHPLRPARRPNG